MKADRAASSLASCACLGRRPDAYRHVYGSDSKFEGTAPRFGGILHNVSTGKDSHGPQRMGYVR
jgi:hypothetical protein